MNEHSGGVLWIVVNMILHFLYVNHTNMPMRFVMRRCHLRALSTSTADTEFVVNKNNKNNIPINNEIYCLERGRHGGGKSVGAHYKGLNSM